MNGRVMSQPHESNQSLNEGEAGTHLGSYTDPGWPGAGEGSCRPMWHARFAAAEPPGGPGSHSPQRRRGAPVGRLARNRNRNRGSLGDTVQGRRRKGEGGEWDSVIWGNRILHSNVMKQCLISDLHGVKVQRTEFKEERFCKATSRCFLTVVRGCVCVNVSLCYLRHRRVYWPATYYML